MRLKAGLALLVASASVAAACQVQPAPTAAPTPRSYPAVQTLYEGYVRDKKMPGIVGAIGEGNAPPTFIAAGALADEAGAGKADADSLWRIYSMTKPITGIAAMMLVEDGKLKLDQPIGDFIPAFKQMRVLTDPANSLASRPATRPITVRHLLTHTAGLGYTIVTKGPLLKEYERLGILPFTTNAALELQVGPARPKSLEEFAARVATLPLIAEPGTRWSYSIGLDLMGRVIEVASGMSFERFLQTRMFGPLKMRSTYWTVPKSEVGRLATGYVWAGERRIPIDPAANSAFLNPPPFPYGGAGLVSSARDYDRFLAMLANDGSLDGARVMKPATVRLAMSNLLPAGVTFGGVAGSTGGAGGADMGFGAGGSVYLRDVPGGASKGTYGWGGAAGTIAWVDPVRKLRGTVMVNYIPSDKWPIRADTVKAVYGGR
jgi:CubicO group peptidase (beta-lactamase class C family)